MSNEFDDDLPAGDGGNPNKEQTVKVYHYLRRRGRKHSTACVEKELVALGFKTSRASVGRFLEGEEGREPTKRASPGTVNKAEKRQQRRRLNNRHEHKVKAKQDNPAPSPVEAALKITPDLIREVEVVKIGTLLAVENGQPKLSDAELAIRENRTRMALNTVIAERMAESPGLLLLDMRGTAALVDALTVASKLSGGASISVTPGAAKQDEAPHANGNGVSPNGYPMRELNPPKPSGLIGDLQKWRQEKAAERAPRT